MADNNYVWKNTIGELIENNRFIYALELHDKGYEGNLIYNKLLKESKSFISFMKKYKPESDYEIKYPDIVDHAVEKKDIDILSCFVVLECHYAFRKIAETQSLTMIIKLYQINFSKYFYKQILKRTDFKLFLEKAKIKINDISPITEGNN